MTPFTLRKADEAVANREYFIIEISNNPSLCEIIHLFECEI